MSNTYPTGRRPVTLAEQRMAERCRQGCVIVIDDDPEIRASFAALLELEGYAVEDHASAQYFLDDLALQEPRFPGPRCVICDVSMPGLSGLELQQRLSGAADLPFILVSGVSGAREVIDAFHAGVIDFLLKPVTAEQLLATVARALQSCLDWSCRTERARELAARVATLTPRERDVVHLVAHGHINRDIADRLGIGLRTVKLYRQKAMEKLGVTCTADFVRVADEAGL